MADLHVGKSAHFRKAGIAVPANIVQEDLFRLQRLITAYHPQKVIVVGDMFHSSANNDVQYFKLWRQQFPNIAFELVVGNHDMLTPALYEDLQIDLYPSLTLRNISFVHDAKDAEGMDYVISGHIHPGVRMVGNGRQRLRLPCFYFGVEVAVLPAFSDFTGLCSLELEEDALVFVIAERKVFRI